MLSSFHIYLTLQGNFPAHRPDSPFMVGYPSASVSFAAKSIRAHQERSHHTFQYLPALMFQQFNFVFSVQDLNRPVYMPKGFRISVAWRGHQTRSLSAPVPSQNPRMPGSSTGSGTGSLIFQKRIQRPICSSSLTNAANVFPLCDPLPAHAEIPAWCMLHGSSITFQSACLPLRPHLSAAEDRWHHDRSPGTRNGISGIAVIGKQSGWSSNPGFRSRP